MCCGEAADVTARDGVLASDARSSVGRLRCRMDDFDCNVVTAEERHQR